jgi:hypothetical protein
MSHCPTRAECTHYERPEVRCVAPAAFICSCVQLFILTQVAIEYRCGITLPDQVPQSCRPSPLGRYTRHFECWSHRETTRHRGANVVLPMNLRGDSITDRKVSGFVPGCSLNCSQPLHIVSHKWIQQVLFMPRRDLRIDSLCLGMYFWHPVKPAPLPCIAAWYP